MHDYVMRNFLSLSSYIMYHHAVAKDSEVRAFQLETLLLGRKQSLECEEGAADSKRVVSLFVINTWRVVVVD